MKGSPTAPEAGPGAVRRSLSITFALVVVGLFGAALAALLLVQQAQRRSLADLLESETRERSGMLHRVIELTGQSLRDFTYDYAQWDDMVTFVAKPQRAWAAVNLDASLDNFNLAAIWVLRTDGTLVYATRGEEARLRPPDLPLPPTAIARVLSGGKSANFFSPSPEGLFELCFAPIQPSEDTARVSEPRGWLVGARLWNDAQLKLIADVIQCEAVLVPPGRPVRAPGSNQISLHHALPGLDGSPAANLEYTLRSHELEIVSRDQRTQLALVAGTFLLTAAIAVYFVFRWIVRPLQQVGESLRTLDARPIAPLLGRADEIGRVARAVQTSFEQHTALEQMIESRTRLGRELHDGVIQTVYAAGMNLTGARSLLRQDPAGAERILEDTRGELNTTIHSLREFIYGLEPETLQQRTFIEAVQSIVALMRGVRPVSTTLQIDRELAANLTSRRRLHLLQVIREALSNSVRHGQSQHVLIRLEREASDIVLEVTDDGIGLEAKSASDGGRGLTNFAARARELGGEIQVSPAPSGGVRVRLAIPSAAKSSPA